MPEFWIVTFTGDAFEGIVMHLLCNYLQVHYRRYYIDEGNSMTQTFQSFIDAVSWQQYYDPLAPKEGAVAPDFELRDVNGENPVRLSSFKDNKPVALIFGSLT